MKNKSIHIKTYIMLWLCIILGMNVVVTPVVKALNGSIPLAMVICLVISFPAAFFGLKILYARAEKKPLSRTHTELLKEFQENGLSDRALELADRGISEVGSSAGDFVYLKTFAIAGCECSIYKGDNMKALQYINLIDIKKIKGGDLSFLDGGASVVSYFTAQMELAKAMNDPVRANNVIADGKPFLDKFYGKNDAVDMLIDDVWFMYHFTLGDIIHAREHALKILNNKIHERDKQIAGYIDMALVCRRMGDEAGVQKFITDAKKITEDSDKAVNRQILEMCFRELALSTELTEKS